MLNYAGNYTIRVKLGQIELAVDPLILPELSIIQDINRYVPSFSMTFIDSTGLLTHIVPTDKRFSTVEIQIGKDLSTKQGNYNDFDFDICARNPVGDITSVATYSAEGLASIKNLVSPCHTRAFTGNIQSSLISLAEELGCKKVEISASLNYTKTLLQSNQTNSEFIDMLRDGLIGKNNEGCYFIYVKREFGENVFVCKTLEDLYKEPVKFKFIVSDKQMEDYYPAFDFDVLDNYKVFGMFGSRKQDYGYYDYYTSEFKTNTLDMSSMYSLSEYHLIDQDDIEDSVMMSELGRNTTSGDSSVLGEVKSSLYRRGNSLIKMWITTVGLPDITPGSIISILFAQGAQGGNLMSYQYSGNWMIERVVHDFTGTHRTRLLLTRSGVDTDKDSTLLKANYKKK